MRIKTSTVNPPISPREAYLIFPLWGGGLLEAGGLLEGGLIKFCREAEKKLTYFHAFYKKITGLWSVLKYTILQNVHKTY